MRRTKIEVSDTFILCHLNIGMRPEIETLARLGPLPLERDATVEQLKEFEKALLAITSPIEDAEARQLVSLFGPDSCFGLAWTLLHLIETAPGWPLKDCLSNAANEWIARLRTRANNKGML